MCARPVRPSIETDGWSLLSAEERHAAHPDTFLIPPRETREALAPGTAAKLLFDIETKEEGRVIDRGVDRMWVIVTGLVGGRYTGVLDSDPGRAGSVNLRQGDAISFGPEHIAQVDYPPAEYLARKYGALFPAAAGGRMRALSIQVQPARADGLDVTGTTKTPTSNLEPRTSNFEPNPEPNPEPEHEPRTENPEV